MVAVVHHYSIQGLGRCESPGSFACCVKFPCYLMLLYTPADQRSRIQLLAGSMTRSRQTFSIPMQSSKPFQYSCCVHLITPWTTWIFEEWIWQSDLAGYNGAWRDPINLIAIPIYSQYIRWSKLWTYFRCNQDLSCNYIEMKFRTYLATKF